MPLHPVFQRKPFTRTALTNSVNRTVRRRKVFETLVNWETSECPLDKAQINVGNDNTVEVVATTPRGGTPPVIDGDKREAMEITIPGFAGRSTVLNIEALGVIAGLDGDAVDLSLQTLIAGRNQKIINVIENSVEHSRAGVFRNKIVDKDGRTILDYKKQFGLEQGAVQFDLSNGAKKLATQFEMAKNATREQVGDDVVDSFMLLVGADYYAALSNHDEYRAAMTNPLNYRLSQADGRDGLTFNTNVEIVPIFSSNWGKQEAKLVPRIDGAFQRIYGPSTASQYWGNVLPYYTTTEPVPHDEGLEMQTWSFVLHYFTHPDAISDVTFKL